ncbi:tRNA nucleotidyltransferase/poly(A) polymerase, RNA and SrmB- binding domain [Dillenia turbinata]|uniref:tRNA nucleotidyltransferase/poly(A) polymerase, RNA and SrmB- binding domain n=1 Tax=Dillenia turbinata TaxID=194707 RepID=A0AAN8UZA7_9MAGN
MAIGGLSFACRTNLTFRPPRPLFLRTHDVRLNFVVAFEMLSDAKTLNNKSSNPQGKLASFYGGIGGRSETKMPKWKKLSSKDLGITTSMIPKPTRVVLNGLKRKGYQVYLVGGCVRDLILKQTPKDFDIITSAELKQVKDTFSQCGIIGRRFPICHVHVNKTIVEVSSFSTQSAKFERDSVFDFGKKPDCDEQDYIRWRDSSRRDFTINGLMFDPYASVVYDYMGGLEDIKKAKVRTVVPASMSFREDCGDTMSHLSYHQMVVLVNCIEFSSLSHACTKARMLRAIRIAARLGFRFPRETAHAIKHLSCSLLRLDKNRLLMEVNYMLAYGSAEASLRLLWKFGLLEVLLPIQAAYFVSLGFQRRDKGTNMLLCLFSNLDKLLTPDKPCDSSLWVAILAFHKALLDQPRDPLTVAAFCLSVHNGGDLREAISIAQSISRPHDARFQELSHPHDMDSRALICEVMDLFESVKGALGMLTDEQYVSQAMAGYSKAPYSDLNSSPEYKLQVFINFGLYLRVCQIFKSIGEGKEKRFEAKQGSKIDYEMLALGGLREVRHVFARVVFDTVYPLNLYQELSSTG